MTRAQTVARLCLLVAVIAGLGLFAASRVSFDTDPLEMLPEDLPEATGLQLFQERFGKDIDLMISISGNDADTVEQAARSLTDHLLARPGLVSRAYWKQPGNTGTSGDFDPQDFAELIAYGWLNASPESWQRLEENLSAERSESSLTDAFDTLAYGQIVDPQLSMFRASIDPLGVVEALPDFGGLLAKGESRDQFQARDGKLRLVRAEAPNDIANYKLTIAWLAEVEPAIRDWQAAASPEIRALAVDWTGRAPYTAEIASSMEREMQWSVIIAILLIHALFFLFYRRFVPIIWLVLCLALTFTITLTIGSFLFDKLGATSVGFAAILIGLAVDYGFVIYQESLKYGSSPQALRRRLAYSIGWAATTTAAVFIGLRLSSLPGASQLGTMVGIGITVGALVMLTLFTWLNHLTPPTSPAAAERAPGSPRASRFGLWVTLGLAGAMALVFSLAGLPPVSTSADDLRPKDSHASRVFVDIWESFGWGDRGGFQVIIAGDDEARVGERITAATGILSADPGGLERETTFPPKVLLASPANQVANREAAQRAVRRAGTILSSATEIERPDNLEVEHVEDILALTRAIFSSMEQLLAQTPQGEPIAPQTETSRWVLDNLVSRDPTPVCALGTIDLPVRTGQNAAALEDEELRLAELLGDGTEGIYPAGWPLLRPAIVRIMRHELIWVVLPMAATLFCMLWLAFRRLRRVALSLAALVFSFSCLLATMSLLDLHPGIRANWNLMNLAAIPLLLGVGLDYSIHMQLALRRLGGDVAEARRTIGRALILCGLSTATGFGTLIWSTNAGLASLGLVCCIGILITMITCVFLLPAWYRWTHPAPR